MKSEKALLRDIRRKNQGMAAYCENRWCELKGKDLVPCLSGPTSSLKEFVRDLPMDSPLWEVMEINPSLYRRS